MGVKLSELLRIGPEVTALPAVFHFDRWFGMQGPGGQSTQLLTSGTAYWCFLGYVIRAGVFPYLNLHVSTAGAGAQTAEVAIASTPISPNRASQSLTKIVATGTVDDLTTTGVKRNTSAFTAIVPVGPAWAGIRTAMATTQPTFNAFNRDFARGNGFTTAAAGVLTAAGPWTGALIAATSGTAEFPVMWGSIE